MKLYVASSWRNSYYPGVVTDLRSRGFDCYDFRNPTPGDRGFSWSEIDPHWGSWRTTEYRAALAHPIARRGFGNDLGGMERADGCVLVLPSGRSAHLEAGWFMGRALPCAVFVPWSEQIEPELMYLLSLGGPSCLCTTVEEVEVYLRAYHDAGQAEGPGAEACAYQAAPRNSAVPRGRRVLL